MKNTKIKCVAALVFIAIAPGCARQNPGKKPNSAKAAVKAPASGGSVAPEANVAPLVAGSVVRSEKSCPGLVVPEGYVKLESKEELFKLGEDFRLTSVRGNFRSVDGAKESSMNAWATVAYGAKEAVEQGIDCVNAKSSDETSISLNLQSVMGFAGSDWNMAELLNLTWKSNEKNEGEMTFDRKSEGHSFRELSKYEDRVPKNWTYNVYATPDKKKFVVFISRTQTIPGTHTESSVVDGRVVESVETKVPASITTEILSFYEKI